jgi:hypothetical protein
MRRLAVADTHRVTLTIAYADPLFRCTISDTSADLCAVSRLNITLGKTNCTNGCKNQKAKNHEFFHGTPPQ